MIERLVGRIQGQATADLLRREVHLLVESLRGRVVGVGVGLLFAAADDRARHRTRRWRRLGRLADLLGASVAGRMILRQRNRELLDSVQAGILLLSRREKLRWNRRWWRLTVLGRRRGQWQAVRSLLGLLLLRDLG